MIESSILEMNFLVFFTKTVHLSPERRAQDEEDVEVQRLSSQPSEQPAADAEGGHQVLVGRRGQPGWEQLHRKW